MDSTIRLIALMLCTIALGCGDKDSKNPAPGPASGAPGNKPGAGGPAGNDNAGSYHTGPQIAFTADYKTSGVMTRSGPVTGKVHVSKDGVHVVMENHPNAGHAVRFLASGDEMWQIDETLEEFERPLSGDWERDVFPRVVAARRVEKIGEGDCPFGHARGNECNKTGADTVAGRKVEVWTFKDRTIWFDPELRAGLKEEFTPFRNNPDTQVVELGNIQLGDPDPTLFKIPAGLTCQSGTFCDDAPVAGQ